AATTANPDTGRLLRATFCGRSAVSDGDQQVPVVDHAGDEQYRHISTRRDSAGVSVAGGEHHRSPFGYQYHRRQLRRSAPAPERHASGCGCARARSAHQSADQEMTARIRLAGILAVATAASLPRPITAQPPATGGFIEA